jgi:hypothetical protein
MADDNPDGALRIKLHPLARADFDYLRDHEPTAFADMIAALKTLATERDPRQPCTKAVNVCRMFPSGNGCYRLKVYGKAFRVAFRMLERDGDWTYVVMPDEAFDERADERYIQVVFADVRDNRTYARFDARYERVQEAG